jgi:hypothetical protein
VGPVRRSERSLREGRAAIPGVHCAPPVHRDLGTVEWGSGCLILGAFTTADEIDAAIGAMCTIAV